ncbi:MAG: OmpA family protein [Planctomycetes bacterium]|nr:OmpA family protein [Planctomycetota bacterium]
MSFSKHGKFVAVLVFAAVFASSGCVSAEQHSRLHWDYDLVLKYNAQLYQQVKDLAQENESLKAASSAPEQSSNQQAQELASRVQGEVDEGGRVVVTLDGGTVNFESGKATISDAGKSTLENIAKVVKDLPAGQFIRIDGHTDDVPINRSDYQSNLHLAAERARAVARVLFGAGVNEDRVFVAGFADNYPKVQGTSAAARTQNRRVEIVIGDAKSLGLVVYGN